MIRLATAALVCALALSRVATAQNISLGEVSLEGLDATDAELAAFEAAEREQYVRARELAEAVLAKAPSSYVAHLVLGQVQHLGEANLPRALFHLQRARALYEERHGEHPGQDAPWRWHATLLRELSSVHGDMEHHEEKLAYIARYNEAYDPDMIAERAWPLMKLGRYKEARLAAELGLAATDRPLQRVFALNALCAIEFEAGNDGASYEACQRAVQDAEERSGRVSAVDLTNLAEAARSLFKLDEAERLALQATLAPPSWYGNPFMELAELYTRQGRFGEALSALKQVPEYRLTRPPHVRDADRNELRRALAAFLLVLGKAESAFEVTGRAINAPDRRAHNSRDPAQDRAVLALLDRRARRMSAQRVLERAVNEPWYEQPLLWVKSLWLEVSAASSGSLAQRLIGDDERLVGSFRLGTARSAVMPPWLCGELVSVLGPGVTNEALQRARARDQRSLAGAYYDALEAEVAWQLGEHARTLELGPRAWDKLPPGEVLLQARTMAIAADSARKLGRAKAARAHYDAAFQRDPGVFRRLEIPVGVRLEVSGALAEEVGDRLLDSPRFDSFAQGLLLEIDADASGGTVCLSGDAGQVIHCSEARAKSDQNGDAVAAMLVETALEEMFAPRIDLTQMDINSLDGMNLAGKNALEEMFEE